MDLFGIKARKIEKFWTWFAQNANGLLDHQRQDLQAEMSRQLSSISSGLVWGMAGGNEHQLPTLEISPGGIHDLLPAMREVFAAAPTIPGWRIVEFRQPSVEGFSLEMGDVKIDADNTLFVAQKQAGSHKIDIAVFLPLPADAPEEALIGAGFILLDHTVGERVVMEDIGHVEFRHASLAPPGANRLSELKALTNLGK